MAVDIEAALARAARQAKEEEEAKGENKEGGESTEKGEEKKQYPPVLSRVAMGRPSKIDFFGVWTSGTGIRNTRKSEL